MGSYTSKDKDFEILDVDIDFPETEETNHQLIIQVTRKINLINALKHYFENADRESIYYKYIIGTLEYETVDEIKSVYKIYSNFFYPIFRMNLFNQGEYNF